MTKPMAEIDTIIRRMGYPDDEQGPFVTALRESVGRQIDRGLISRSAGTWAPGAELLTHEQRAKAQLAFDWAAENGYAYRIECLDPIVYRSFTVLCSKRTKAGASAT